MSAARMEVKGECVCGKVSYTSLQKGPILPIIYCHCKDCQQSHSAPFTNVWMSPVADTTWLGKEHLSSYNRRGSNERLFCETCHVQMASHLYKGTDKARYAFFQSSIRSCPMKQQPVMHIFTKEATVPLPDDGLKRR